MTKSIKRCMGAALFVALVASPLVLVSAERRTARLAREAAQKADTVELFAAIDAKAIEVSFVPKDSTEAKVTIKNKTGKPLNVRLPEAFAGVPVLKQLGAGGAGGGRNGAGGNGGGQNQSMGGGMGGMGGGMMGGGMMGGGMGMGMMNIPAEKVAQFRVPCVCLEHGKREPRSGVAYQIKPLETLTDKPEVRELLTAFGKRRLNQRAVQAAAWHLANGMSWQELAAKQTDNLGGINGPFFAPDEVMAGMQMAAYSIGQTEAKERISRAAKNSPSLSQSTGGGR